MLKLAIKYKETVDSLFMSICDMEEYAYPEAAQLIFTPRAGTWKCSAFRIISEKWEEIDVRVVKR